MRRFVWLWALVGSCLLAGTARGGNPRLSLSLSAVTAPEALSAVAIASGVDLRFQENDLPGGAAPTHEQKGKRADFHWTKARLSQVLRDLCSTYGLRMRQGLSWHAFSYTTVQERDPPPLAQTEVKGLRMTIRAIVSQGVRHSGDPRNQMMTPGSLTLTFEGDGPDGEGAAISGVAKVTAKDDRGNILVQEPASYAPPLAGGTFPDQWRATVMTTAPNPSARKLKWLEGDLMRAEVYEPFRIEADLPKSGPSPAVNGVSAEVLEFGDRGELSPGTFTSVRIPTLRYRMVYPRDTVLYSRFGEHSFTPVLIDEYGRHYWPTSTFGGIGFGQTAGQTTGEYRAIYPSSRERFKSVVFQGYKKSGSVKVGHFRIENIDLPTASPVFTYRSTATINSARAEARRFYAAPGGALSSQVIIGKAPVREGYVAFGLLRAEDRDEPVEWYEMPIDSNGLARVTGLKAGDYRLFRIYHPRLTPLTPGDGEWKNSEVRIKIRAGQEVATKPLRWEKSG